MTPTESTQAQSVTTTAAPGPVLSGPGTQPAPPFAPVAGGGGKSSNTTQGIFNRAWWASKPPSWYGLYNSLSGSPTENVDQLSASDRIALIKSLWSSGAQLDPLIDAGGLDPYSIMYSRITDGFSWIAPGTGLDESNDVVTQGNTLPVPPGMIPVTLTPPAPFPIPVATPPPSPNAPIALNPVGIRITMYSLNGLGDLFRCAVANDGYPTDGTGIWKGTTAQGFSGTFTKVAEEMGMMICWQMTAIGAPAVSGSGS